MRQGYLILHEKRGRPCVYYFSLEDGFLRYYMSAQCQRVVGEVRLSGCKLAVKAQKRHDLVPNSFYLEARKVFVKDRTYTLGAPVRVELSAHSADERQEWGKALFSWQRYYWRDPRAPSSSDPSVPDDAAVKQQLEQVLDRFFASKTEPALTAGLALSVAKQPLGFLRRNASSLRRSLSISLSASSTASTSSSTVSDQTPSKPEHDEPAAYCPADKAPHNKVGTKDSRGFALAVNNQEEHAY